MYEEPVEKCVRQILAAIQEAYDALVAIGCPEIPDVITSWDAQGVAEWCRAQLGGILEGHRLQTLGYTEEDSAGEIYDQYGDVPGIWLAMYHRCQVSDINIDILYEQYQKLVEVMNLKENEPQYFFVDSISWSNEDKPLFWLTIKNITEKTDKERLALIHKLSKKEGTPP
jgi:hypothetical protein